MKQLGTLSLGETVFGGGNSNIFVSNDSGITWETIQDLTIPHIFSSSSDNDELKYKIIANESITINTPLFIKVN